MASSVQGFIELPESRYDLNTYTGRVRHCLEISDPFMLLNTKNDIKASRDLIQQYKNGIIKTMSPELWKAKKILDSTLHPDTGEVVYLPFRMSSYVLSNLVVTVGMLTPNLGTFGTLFWQITNQSLNVAINTSNANKSHPLTTQQLITNYFLAVSASCSVALGLNSIVPRLKNVSQNTKTILGRLVPFAAVISAGIVNVVLMRGEELRKGISIFNKENNEEVGISKIAAKYAVGETALSRVINATPIMVIPPLILVKLQNGFLKGRGVGMTTLANVGLYLATSFTVLPLALAVFPQKRELSVKKLEERFNNLKDRNGNPINYIQFNRGM
ncbi:Fsf1p [Ascoidea rubescens DSM 1968]|uniref:Sidoreflexin n=1 Tax=Ascoidea rubescens DSM 1968 TaxID=1344418 RepID=A0A1D2VB40_9ASCO|nr:tricarboxylate carrier [Ascoidea rubescens DSM 1968]ODV58836.1 tricarboxylate carrier [Ascoidea rubescens DSM 1968]